MATKRAPDYYFVCLKCLEDNPRNFELTTRKCISQDAHLNSRSVRVWEWRHNGILEIYPSVNDKPVVRPQPMFLNFSGNFKLCHKATSNGCRNRACNHAHSVEEMERWNAIKAQPRSWQTSQTPPGYVQEDYPRQFQKSPGQGYQGASGTARRRDPTARSPVPPVRHEQQTPKYTKKEFSNEEMSLLSLALSRSNYKKKLELLLNLEQLAHEDELKARCDGDYKLFILDESTEKDSSYKNGGRAKYSTEVYLTGLDGDQISYATQASRTVTITCIDVAQRCKIQADILPRNYNHTEEKLYLGTNDQNTVYALGKSHQGFTVHVQFKLKYQYFDRLRDSVARVPSKVVSRIVPDGFPPTLDSYLNESLDLKPFEDNLSLKLCSNDQQDALKVMPISSCSKGEPPFLLTGPFGSGKTRLLALAAHISFRSLTSMHLLVCVQQHVSAGAFLSCFNDLASAKDVFVVQVVTERKYRLADYQPICKTVSQLQEMEERGHFARKKKVMVIATCSTANNLLYNEVFQPGYFTHIYIDEGAQMREPEAVAPLGFATEDTVLVIAGDQHQVGPAMLVLGEKPQTCGLSVSLVERLHKVYTEETPDEGVRCHRALTTNFRCHPDIMKLSGDLFYKANVACKVKPHEDAPFPFHFVCSGVDDVLQPLEKHTSYDKEAKIVADEMVKFSKPGLVFPLDGSRPDTSQFAYASPCRSQLSTVERYIKEHVKLRSVKKVPIYDIQGNEYQALFLSTTEPTNKDGSTLNPTKSICDPFVFNTVISRARSVVVSVGNPFTLLRKETHMVKKYGDKAKCWSSYLRLCLEKGTLSAAPSLELTEEEWKWKKSSIQGLVFQQTEQTEKSVPYVGFAPQEVKLISEEASGENTLPLQSPQSAGGSQESPVLTPRPEATQKSNEIAEETTKSRKSSLTTTEDAKFTREFKVTVRLGKGGYGVVYGARHILDEADYAVKIIKLNPKSKKDVNREVKALALLKHPRIVRYFTSWTETLPEGWETHSLWADLKDSETYTQHELENKRLEAGKVNPLAILEEQPSPDDSFEIVFKKESDDTTRKTQETNKSSTSSSPEPEPQRKPSLPVEPTCLFIQTELCERGTLRDWLTDNTRSRPREKMLLFSKQILEAVKYIHSQKFIHRDLKPSNILFEKDVKDSLKVGDFGLVIPWEKSPLAKAALSPKSVSRKGGKARPHTANAGTELYRSPEQQDKKQYNSKVDIFALGLIFFELNYPMVTGHEMNKVFNDLRRKGREGFPPEFERQLPDEARLIGAMVGLIPDERPTAKEILEGEDLQKIEDDINSKRLPTVSILSQADHLHLTHV